MVKKFVKYLKSDIYTLLGLIITAILWNDAILRLGILSCILFIRIIRLFRRF